MMLKELPLSLKEFYIHKVRPVRTELDQSRRLINHEDKKSIRTKSSFTCKIERQVAKHTHVARPSNFIFPWKNLIDPGLDENAENTKHT